MIYDGIRETLEYLETIKRVMDPMKTIKELTSRHHTIQQIIPDTNILNSSTIESIRQLNIVNSELQQNLSWYNSVIDKDIIYNSKLYTDTSTRLKAYYSLLKIVQDLKSNETIKEYQPTEIITKEQQNIAEELTEDILECKEDWQKRTYDKLIRIKEKNPILYPFVLWLIGTIAATLIGVGINFVIVKTNALLREKPSQTSAVSNYIESDTILFEKPSDIKYYSNVFMIEKETGHVIDGWISKRSIQQFISDETITP